MNESENLKCAELVLVVRHDFASSRHYIVFKNRSFAHISFFISSRRYRYKPKTMKRSTTGLKRNWHFPQVQTPLSLIIRRAFLHYISLPCFFLLVPLPFLFLFLLFFFLFFSDAWRKESFRKANLYVSGR